MIKNIKISMIAAVAKNNVIGDTKSNSMLWHIPEDFKHFKQKTTGHTVIMGSRTFESMGKPLSNRTNVVITSKNDYKAPGCIIVHSVDEAVGAAIGRPSAPAPSSPLGGEDKGEGEIFVIGGGNIYKQFISKADKLYITLVDKEFPEADVFFPAFDEFKKITQTGEGEHEGIKYKFLELERWAL
jgi:dihydrofolate reductase